MPEAGVVRLYHIGEIPFSLCMLVRSDMQVRGQTIPILSQCAEYLLLRVSLNLHIQKFSVAIIYNVLSLCFCIGEQAAQNEPGFSTAGGGSSQDSLTWLPAFIVLSDHISQIPLCHSQSSLSLKKCITVYI